MPKKNVHHTCHLNKRARQKQCDEILEMLFYLVEKSKVHALNFCPGKLIARHNKNELYLERFLPSHYPTNPSCDFYGCCDYHDCISFRVDGDTTLGCLTRVRLY